MDVFTVKKQLIFKAKDSNKKGFWKLTSINKEEIGVYDGLYTEVVEFAFSLKEWVKQIPDSGEVVLGTIEAVEPSYRGEFFKISSDSVAYKAEIISKIDYLKILLKDTENELFNLYGIKIEVEEKVEEVKK